MRDKLQPRLEPPCRLRVARGDEDVAGIASDGATAVIVCHGMGQHLPFEALGDVAQAICDKHIAQGGAAEIALRVVKPDEADQPLLCAELVLHRQGAHDRHVHLYEAYWAPLTEGVISYWQAARFLVRSGFAGLRAAWIQRGFPRWMFGAERRLPIKDGTYQLLSILLLTISPLLLLGALGAAVLLLALIGTPFIDWKPLFGEISSAALLMTLLPLAFLAIRFRNFVVQYMGDVAIYVSSNELNTFWQTRDAIRRICYQVASYVYGAVQDCTASADTDGVPASLHVASARSRLRLRYSKVIMVGHSLGSVVAYDALNAVINEDRMKEARLKIVERTEALITFGSPLDKTAFLFQEKAKHGAVLRVLAAGVQPLIQDYSYRPNWWINVYCKCDVISGPLDYYDDPDQTGHPRSIRNCQDKCTTIRADAAHTGYWEREPARTILHLAAIGGLGSSEGKAFLQSAADPPSSRSSSRQTSDDQLPILP